MKYYNITILINLSHSERIQDIIKKYKSMIENAEGKIHTLDDLGKKQLAYQIKKMHKAHYVFMTIECTQKTLEALALSFKFNEAIIRSLILKK